MNTVNPAGSIPNHLAWSIIATVLATCLCCPLGLVGIVAWGLIAFGVCQVSGCL